ncbi:GDSL esterase/lipase At1g28580-like isoform X2 [Arachis duranensis]|uniref:GDSL esterase/lipase At1g28580-like isoform X2 n=1 Tax=Arachis duranensis TaxID=130453 RepID=A0A9C6TFA1_ARADU|nr:GDSL esterase/lipase At1g28580-like isoform X2 [Arachis duranensis]
MVNPIKIIKKGKIKDWNSLEGVNFAVGGVTALDISFLVEKGLYDVLVPTNYSLGVQFDWFMDLLPSICNSSSGCKQVFGSSLFLVGEIGGNDFNYLFYLGRPIEEATTYVPLVINKISWAINKLIDLGAQTLVVPGNFALGCSFVYLRSHPSTDVEDYDEAGCLKSYNNFADYYNNQLLAELNRLRQLHPGVNIIYADYYHASLQLYRSPTQFGFTKSILDSCCPLANANYHNPPAKHCGEPGLISCNDPSQFITWDGVHLTEAAYNGQKLFVQGARISFSIWDVSVFLDGIVKQETGISASFFIGTKAMCALARDRSTVWASTHQPCSEVFELMDPLYSLEGGSAIYCRQASEAYEIWC